MNQDLSNLIKKKKKKQTGAGGTINWDARRDKYLDAVDNLYGQIESILADPIAKKAVKLVRRTKTLAENYIGTYTVDDLILLIGGEQVRFSPAGRNVAGASGRVDVVGDRDTAVLLVQIDGRWSYIKTRQPTLRAIAFGESALAQVLQRVMQA
jgi:hypothetical protein